MHGVKLPPALLADLYGDMLVIVGDTQPKAVGAEEEVIARIQLPKEVAPAEKPVITATERKPEPEKPVEKQQQESPLLGRYNRKILVVVHESAYTHCSEDDLQFLQKILQALKLSMNDIGILNLAQHPHDYTALANAFAPGEVLLLGPDAASLELPMRFPQFQVQPWGKVSFLQAPALREMNGDSEEQKLQKKKLWEGLKRMFGT